MSENELINEINSYLLDTSLEQIRIKNCNRLKFEIRLNSELKNTKIEALDLNARPYNGLMRAGYTSIGMLVSRVRENQDLTGIRGMGKRSIEEVMLHLFLYQFSILNREQKAEYIKKFKNMNSL